MENIKKNSHPDFARQILNLLAAPLIWICSSLGFFMGSARSPSDFSDLSENSLVPYTLAFSIWLPIFVGILIYAVVQMMGTNKTREVFRTTGWWVAAGLWGIVLWGLVTSFAPTSVVELLATLIFIPSMIALVIAMVRLTRRNKALDTMEKIFVLTPISLIAGWCSIAVFVGLNGLIWSYVETLGWSATGTALSVLGLALWWIIFVLRQGAANMIYAFPVVWGLGFLALRHFGSGGSIWIFSVALIGIVAVILAATVRTDTPTKYKV
jgi:hypothetical protein